jgi:hypothetical protein
MIEVALTEVAQAIRGALDVERTDTGLFPSGSRKDSPTRCPMRSPMRSFVTHLECVSSSRQTRRRSSSISLHTGRPLGDLERLPCLEAVSARR